MQKTALVLSGGGARGAYQIGVWQALLELGIDIDIVTGTSVGALNGAMVVSGAFENAVNVWSRIEMAQVFSMQYNENSKFSQKVKAVIANFFQGGIHKYGLDIAPLHDLLDEYVDEKKVRSSRTDFGFVTFDLKRKKPEELFMDHVPQGKLNDYIFASASCFPAIQAYEIDGMKCIDGGIYDNIPVEMAVKKGAKRIIVVDLDAIGIVRKESFKQAENLIDLKSYWNLGPFFIFEKEQSRRNMRLGYLDTLKVFDAFYGFAYTFIKKVKPQTVLEKLRALLAIDLASGTSLQKVTHRILEGHIGSKFQNKYTLLSDYFWICIETAGEVFDLDPLLIYSFDKFNEKLAIKVQNIKIPYVGAQVSSENKFEKWKEALNLLEKPVRTLMMAKALDERKNDEPSKILPLSNVMQDEYLAACYLNAAGILTKAE